MNLFELAEQPPPMDGGLPQLLPIQLDLLDRGRRAFAAGARRVIWQAPCGAGKTWIAAEQTRRALEKGKTVLHMVHRRRLVDQMLWTLAKFGITGSPIMDGRQTWNSPVYCASRDTLLAMIKDGVSLPAVDLFIPDECHVAAAAVQDYYLRFAPYMHWCGYTATPCKPDGGSLNPPWQDLVQMGSAGDLVQLGRLCPVKFYDPEELGRRRRKGEKVKPAGDPVAHWKRYANGLPTVVYAATVAESKRIVAAYLAAGITAEHLDASTPEDEREAMFERSRTGRTLLLSNCGVLVEGVDLPWLVCCQILRGCNSLVLWVQAIGRVMRTCPGKDHGIILDHSGAVHEFWTPDLAFSWTLEDESANRKKNAQPADRKPVTCPRCAAVFAWRAACPECGKVMQRPKRAAMAFTEAGDGVLTAFVGQQAGQQTADALLRLARKAFYVARSRGGSMGMANAIFAGKAKMPMWDAGLDLNLPTGGEWKTPAAEWNLYAEKVTL